MSQADRIRQFVLDRYVSPARAKGESKITIRAGDVHRAMGLANRMPAVCNAIGGNRFEDIARATLINRTGPANGANVYFEFRLTAAPSPAQHAVSPRPPSFTQRVMEGIKRFTQKLKPQAHEAKSEVARPPPAQTRNDLDFANTIVLVSCVRRKLPDPAPARSLYTSTWFWKTRDIVEASGARWFVLSALYGLVAPDAEIAPYDHTLNTLGVAARHEWATDVLRKLIPEIETAGVKRVVMFAGDRYREFLVEPLQSRGIKVEVPMEGLRIGEQLAWLSEHYPNPNIRMSRVADLKRFYALLDLLNQRLGGTRTLATFDSFRDWPERGVYLFFEPSEARKESGAGPRVVRVGTHALRTDSPSTLRQRLGQHRGYASGGGSHRGSIFRQLVGEALLARGGLLPCNSWGVEGDAAKASAALGIDREALATAEAPVEQAVSRYIAGMPFLWLDVNDEPGPNSLRGAIERNAIALLSNCGRAPLDPPSLGWLGYSSDRPLVRCSGLWNQHHVEEIHDPRFLDALANMIERTGSE
jgi:hypothetical protein